MPFLKKTALFLSFFVSPPASKLVNQRPTGSKVESHDVGSLSSSSTGKSVWSGCIPDGWSDRHLGGTHFRGGGEIKLDAHILLNFLVMTADEDDWMGIWVVATSNIFGIFTPKLGEDTPF